MPNQALAQQVLDTIRANEALFEMANWFTQNGQDTTWLSPGEDTLPYQVEIAREDIEDPSCGTTMCLAGHAAVASGYVLKSTPVLFGVVAHKNSDVVLWPEPGVGSRRQYTDFDAMGAELLDIDYGYAEQLFRSDNDIARMILEKLATGVEVDWENDLYPDDDGSCDCSCNDEA